MADLGIYAGLIFVAFLAATILPVQSELGLAGLMLSDDQRWDGPGRSRSAGRSG